MKTSADIYKKIGANPATISAPKPAPYTEPFSLDIMGLASGYKPPVQPAVPVQPVVPVAPAVPKTRPSDAIYAKIGVQSKDVVADAPRDLNDEQAIRDWLMAPASNRMANSTQDVPDESTNGTYDRFIKPKEINIKPIGFSEAEAKDLPGIKLPGILGAPAKFLYDGVKYLAEAPAIVVTELRSAKEQFDAAKEGRAPKPIQTMIDTSRYDLPFSKGTSVESLFERSMDQLGEYDKESPNTPFLNSVRVLLEGPLTASFAAGDAGAFWSGINKAVIKNIAVPAIEHRAAWQMLGRPATVEEADKTVKTLLVELSNETNGFQNGGTDIAKKLINAKEVIEKQGIPKNPGKVGTAVRRTAEILEAPIEDVPRMIRQGTADVPVAPYARPAGALPGGAIENPDAPMLGLSTEKITPVGYADSAPATKYKTVDEFVKAQTAVEHATSGEIKEGITGSYFAPAGATDSGFGNTIVKRYIAPDAIVYSPPGGSTEAYAQLKGLMDQPDPELQEKYGVDTLKELRDSDDLGDPNDYFFEVQKKTIPLMRAESGADVILLKNEDDLNPTQYVVQNPKVLMTKEDLVNLYNKTSSSPASVRQKISFEENGLWEEMDNPDMDIPVAQDFESITKESTDGYTKREIAESWLDRIAEDGVVPEITPSGDLVLYRGSLEDSLARPNTYLTANKEAAEQYGKVSKFTVDPRDVSYSQSEDNFIYTPRDGSILPGSAVSAYKRFLFSKLQGSKATLAEARMLINKAIEGNPVRIVFTDELIDKVATGEYSELTDDAGIITPIITLYQEGGFTGAETALHEAGHYILNRLFTEGEKKMALSLAAKEITKIQKLAYAAKGYSKEEYLEEFIMDKYAKAQAKREGYQGKWGKVFDVIDRIVKKVIDTFKQIKKIHQDIVKKRGGSGGYVRINKEPLDVNTLKAVSEETQAGPIADILEKKYTSLSRKTIEMFSKRLAKLKSTDEIQGLVDVVEKMNQEVNQNAVTRAYTKESLPPEEDRTSAEDWAEDPDTLPPTVGELLTKPEKSSYLDSLARTIGDPQQAALAFAEYDQIWEKINARAIIEFEELSIEREILNEVIGQNTGKDFIKYFAGKDPRTTTLYDLFTQAAGTDKKVASVDIYLEEKGFADFDDAQKGIENYLDVRDRLVEIKEQMRDLRPQVATARLLKDFLDDVPVLQDQPAITAIDEVSNTADVRGTYKDISGLQKEALDPFRIMRNFFGPRFDVIKKTIVDPFDRSKGAMVDEIDKLATQLEKNVTDKYGIARGSKDAQRVREYGEGKKSMTDLIAEVGEERALEISAADAFFRDFFGGLLDEANEVLATIYPNNPEKLIPKHANYYRHLRDKNALGDALTALKGLFETPAGISPQLAGKSETTKPRSKWLAFAQRRLGEATDTDAIEGTIDYITAFAYLKHISPHISKFRYLRRRLAEVAPTPGDPAEMGIGKEDGINNFLVFLDNYSNRLAGKSHPLDRWITDTMPGGRRMMNVITWVNNRVKANTILGKASSVVAQLANIPTGIASAKQYAIPGMRRTLGSIFKENLPIKQSDFIKERNLGSLKERFQVEWADHPIERTIDTGRNFLAWLLKAGDAVGTNFIWNSHYEKALAEGIEDPVRYADNRTRSIVAGRGIGEVPLGQESKVFQVLAPFQIEVGNLLWVMRDFVKARDLAGLVLLAVGNYLYNEVAEKVRGSRVVFDPINALVEGTALLNDEDDKVRGGLKFVGRQVGEILSNIPLGQTVAGQIPDSTVQQVTNFLTDTPMTKQDIFGQGDPGRFGSGFLVWKALEDPIFRFALPYAGLQAKTTMEGIQSYIDGEVKDKNDKLNFNMDKTFGSLLQSVLFGKNATIEAQKYFDEREDLFQLIDAQDVTSDEFAADAEEEWAKIKEAKEESGGEVAKQMLKTVNSQNPKMAEKIIDIAKMEAKGFDGRDRLIKQLGIENGMRAKFIVEKLDDLETKEEKKAYMKDLATKDLLSDLVLDQVKYLLSKKKKSE